MNRVTLAVLLAGLAVLAAGCSKKEADKPLEKTVNVTTAVAVQKDLPITESAVGSSTSLGVAQALDPNSVRRGTVTIRLPFPLDIVRRLKIGQPVNLTNFEDGKKAVGVVREIRPALSTMTQTVEVIVDVRDPGGWRPAGSVRGEVTLDIHRNASVVPEQAVVLRPAGAVVYVPAGDLVKERAVQTGQLRDGEIEILAGLKAGETVVVDGAGLLSDGARITRRAAAADAKTQP